jgi:hypothetical protein
MVGPLWHFDQEQKRLLARGLIEKRIPGFSIWNISQVEQGVLAGLESEEKQDILARRTAVAVMDILQGEKPSSVDVEFLRGRRLTINMATARVLDIYPSPLTLFGSLSRLCILLEFSFNKIVEKKRQWLTGDSKCSNIAKLMLMIRFNASWNRR